MREPKEEAIRIMREARDKLAEVGCQSVIMASAIEDNVLGVMLVSSCTEEETAVLCETVAAGMRREPLADEEDLADGRVLN